MGQRLKHVMRKTWRPLASALIILACLAQWGPFALPEQGVRAQTEINRMGTVRVSSSANIRSVPTTQNNRPLDSVSNGHRLMVLSSETGQSITNYGNLWYRIRYEKSNGTTIEGYIVAGFVVLDPETLPDPDPDVDFETWLDQQKFPESYRPALRQLHAKYPSWIFRSVPTRLKFWDAVELMHEPGRTLMYNSEDDGWKSLDPKAYNWSTNKWTVFDGSTWIMCSRELIAYYMDPRNMLTEPDVFQFESLNFQPAVHHLAGVEGVLQHSFMGQNSFTYTDPATNKAVTMSYAQAFMEAAAFSNVNPYHLASRSAVELGNNNSPSVSGLFSEALRARNLPVTTEFDGHYNFYNIGASASTAPLGNVRNGLQFAKYGEKRNANLPLTANDLARLIPWNTPLRSICGGAYDIGIRYINASLNPSGNYADQNTIYLQKYNVAYASTRRYWHLYMGSIYAPPVEGAKLYNGYASMGDLDKPITFLIPLYDDMPAQVPKPAKTGNPNNWLKTLSVQDQSLTPSFSPSNTGPYSLIVDASVSSIQLSAAAVAGTSKVTGTGLVNLRVGTNTLNVVVTAQNGKKRTYQLSVIRRPDPDNPELDDSLVHVEPDPEHLCLENDLLIGLDPASGAPTADRLKECLTVPEGHSLRLFAPDGTEAKDPIGTGTRVALVSDEDNISVQTYFVLIYGAINGDGKISSSDMNAIFRHVLRRDTLQDIHLEAADVDRNGKITSSDMNAIFRHVLRRQVIEQRKTGEGS